MTNNLELSQYLIKKHDLKQGNCWDCGAAVISIIKRIRERYQGDVEDMELGELDFKKERRELREECLWENKK